MIIAFIGNDGSGKTTLASRFREILEALGFDVHYRVEFNYFLLIHLFSSIRHGETGILVPSRDVEALAEVLISLLTDDYLREKLSRNALEWSKQFSWCRTVEELLKVINNAVKA